MTPESRLKHGQFGIVDIVAVSWKSLTENLKLYLEFASWSAVIGLFLWLMAVTVREMVTDRLMANLTMTLISIPFSLTFSVISLAMIEAVWKSLNRKKPTMRECLLSGLHRLVGFVWLSLLTGLVFLILPIGTFGLAFAAVTSLGPILAQSFWLYGLAISLLAAIAGAMLMIPVYYALPIYFSGDFFMIDGFRGWACLRRCGDLVRGRWWRTLWRLAVPGVFFWLAAEFVLRTSFLVMGSVAGDPGLFFGADNTVGTAYLIRGSLALIATELVYGLAAPLFVGANLIVWNDLKRLEEK